MIVRSAGLPPLWKQSIMCFYWLIHEVDHKRRQGILDWIFKTAQFLLEIMFNRFFMSTI